MHYVMDKFTIYICTGCEFILVHLFSVLRTKNNITFLNDFPLVQWVWFKNQYISKKFQDDKIRQRFGF